MTRAHPLVIGHRGAPGYRPEHTRSSYELALEFGVDAVEPDAVLSRDGVLVVRHENEIGSTTDVADRAEFADRRTTKVVDGASLTGWFTEDFTWDELSTLRARERLPRIRPGSAAHDDSEPILRLRDVLDLVRTAPVARPGGAGVVLEIKHPTYFDGLGFDTAAIVAAEVEAAGWGDGIRPLWVECFEQSVLVRLRAAGLTATYVFLVESAGAPFDLVTAHGARARTYAAHLEPAGLDRLAREVDGISLDKSLLLGRRGRDDDVAGQAAERGLQVFTWTCRPENTFLARRYRGAGGPAAFGDYASEWAALATRGLDGVFVDHPDLGTAFFGS